MGLGLCGPVGGGAVSTCPLPCLPVSLPTRELALRGASGHPLSPEWGLYPRPTSDPAPLLAGKNHREKGELYRRQLGNSLTVKDWPIMLEYRMPAFFFSFLVFDMWDLSFPTRDRTRALCIGNPES